MACPGHTGAVTPGPEVPLSPRRPVNSAFGGDSEELLLLHKLNLLHGCMLGFLHEHECL